MPTIPHFICRIAALRSSMLVALSSHVNAWYRAETSSHNLPISRVHPKSCVLFELVGRASRMTRSIPSATCISNIMTRNSLDLFSTLRVSESRHPRATSVHPANSISPSCCILSATLRRTLVTHSWSGLLTISEYTQHATSDILPRCLFHTFAHSTVLAYIEHFEQTRKECCMTRRCSQRPFTKLAGCVEPLRIPICQHTNFYTELR